MCQDEKKTVGAASLEVLEKEPFNPDVEAQQRAMLSDFESNFHQAFTRGKAQFLGDFYVVVITKKERLLENVLRNYFLVRESCPTPDFDQIVYRYDKKQDMIDLLWTIPNQTACEIIYGDPINVPQDHKALLKNIISFFDGSLLKKCKTLNGELKESTASQCFNPNDFNEQENSVIIGSKDGSRRNTK